MNLIEPLLCILHMTYGMIHSVTEDVTVGEMTCESRHHVSDTNRGFNRKIKRTSIDNSAEP